MSWLRTLNKWLARFHLRVVRFPDHALTVEHHGVRYDYDAMLLFRYAPWLSDRDFQRVYAIARPHTLVDEQRCYELHDLVRSLAHLQGDLLEVGVWRGGTGLILAAAAQRHLPGSTVHLCDTFAGVVKAGELDSRYRGGEHADTSIGHVRALLQQAGLARVELQQGIFPEQAPPQMRDRQYVFCHIDVDVYQSAADIVDWVQPRMPRGGIVVFDDYGFRHCDGITRLVNELRDNGAWQFFYNLNGHAILIKRD